MKKALKAYSLLSGFLLMGLVLCAQTNRKVHAQKSKTNSDTIRYTEAADTNHKNSSTRDSSDYLSDIQELDKVVILSPLVFRNDEERKKYLLLRYKTRRVWPYAVLAADRLETFRERLDSLDTKRQKRIYTRRVQQYMENEFSEELKKLTKSEGQILVKLLHRQTGETTFEVIRDVRNGWRAFRYNITASFFTISLKAEYDPYEDKEDYIIEHILQGYFQYRQLEPQKPAVEIDYERLIEKWGNSNLFD